MAITSAMRTQVTELYTSLFGRAPEADGLGYWVSRLGAGDSVTKIANEMFGVSAARAVYPSFLTNEEIVGKFYSNVLGRTADTAGLAFWTAKLNATGATVGAVVIELIQAVKTYSGSDAAALTSQALFANKVDAGLYYAVTLGGNSTTNSVLASVTATDNGHSSADVLVNQANAVALSILTDATNATIVKGTNLSLNTGDEITGSVASSLNLTMVDGTAPGVATVTAVGNINVTALASNTLNAALMTNVGSVNLVSGTTAAQTLTVSNLQVATNVGISTGTNDTIVVTYRDASGTADNAKLTLAGNGTSTTASSITLGASDIEAATILTSGTNYDTLVLGTKAATVAVNGTGANTLTFSTTGATLALTAAATTGAQTYTFAAGSIDSADTITLLGTSAADKVTANTYTSMPKMTGVETFVTTLNTTGFFDMTNVTGLTTLTLNEGTAAEAVAITNQSASLTALNINGPTLATSVNYNTGVAAALTVSYGKGAGTTMYDTDFNSLSVTNVKTLGVVFAGAGAAAGGDMGAGTITLDKAKTESLTLSSTASDAVDLEVKRADSLTSLTITASGTSSSVNVTTLSFATDHAVQKLQHLALTASGENSYVEIDSFGGGSYTSSSNAITATSNALALKDISILASGNSSEVYVNSDIVTVGNISTITIEASGNDASAYIDNDIAVLGNVGTLSIIASGVSSNAAITASNVLIDGNLTALNLIASGANSEVWFYPPESGTADLIVTGNVGSITLEASGHSASAYLTADTLIQGNLGSLNIVASGTDSSAFFESQLSVSGDVGSISITASGANSTAEFTDQIWIGGNLTSLNITASGTSSYASLSSTLSVSGDVGSVNITASGADSSAYMDSNIWIGGDLGSLNITASGNSATASMNSTLSVSGSLGSVSITASGADSTAEMASNIWVGVDLGTLTITSSGNSSYASLDSLTVDGDVGSIAITASGASSTAVMYNAEVGGDLGSLTVLASGSNALACASQIDVNGGLVTGAISIKATGAGSSAYATMSSSSGTGLNLAGSLTIMATNSNADATFSANLGTGSLSGATVISASKSGSYAELDLTANSMAGVTVATGVATSSGVDLFLTLTAQSGTISASGAGQLYVDVSGGESITSLSAGSVTGAVTFIADVSDVGAMTITTGAGADSIHSGKGGDTINVGSGTDTVYIDFYNASTNGTANIASGLTIASSMDKITGLGNGDKIDVSAESGTDTTMTLGTSLLGALTDSASAGLALVRGIYNTTTGTWTAGSTDSTYNDYMLNIADGTHYTSVLLLDIVGTVSAAAVADVITLTVA